MNIIAIQPDTIIATSFIVKCRTLELFTSATFVVSLLDVNNTIISSQFITLTTEQYLMWNNNDDYITNLVASILGVTPVVPKPVPEPEPEPVPESVPEPEPEPVPESVPEPVMTI
jgi:hypothetical protein